MLVALISVGLYFVAWHLGPMRSLEGYTLDLRFRLRGAQAPGDEVALVLIDDRSIAELGRWPWNRTLFADGVDRLGAAGARVIVFDLLFGEPDESLPPDVIEWVRRSAAGSPPPWKAVDPGRLNADGHLAQAMARAGNVLVPFALSADVSRANPGDPIPEPVQASAYRTIHRKGGARPALPLAGQAVRAPVPEIARGAAALGHVNVLLAADGAARFAYPVAQVGDAYYPSLAVQAARMYLGYAPEEVRLELGRGLRLGALDVPTDEAMRTVVSYYGPDGTFPAHSFTDLVHGRVSPDALRGRIVLIGAKAPGISDRFPSPFSATLSGSERIATVIENLLREDVLVRRPKLWAIDLGIALLGALLLALVARSLSAYTLVGVTVALLGLLFVVDYLALVRAGLWLDLTLPATVVVATYAAIAVAHYLHQVLLERTVRRAFGRYLHPQLVHSLIATGFESEPGARVATILFTDVAGFTSTAERMTPEQVVRVLNEYFTAITAPIERHGGLITQYQGDALLAVFNVPFENPRHAVNAVRAALEILAIVNERTFGDGVRLHTRIGINTGEVVAGSVGSESHVTYTVHGDAVNLAARLEALNKEHATSLLVSETTAAHLGGAFRCQPIGELPIRGKQQPVVVYRVSEGGPAPRV
ncbi:MAG: adenylate/guanylate cyclase domain-containing protein [Gammaproteobacteria bacterium]|nr:adenylate/guanylate cyclase domain-containing protein [Gammaproteobacteria bacterium]